MTPALKLLKSFGCTSWMQVKILYLFIETYVVNKNKSDLYLKNKTLEK